jgi:hypothetical protein
MPAMRAWRLLLLVLLGAAAIPATASPRDHQIDLGEEGRIGLGDAQVVKGQAILNQSDPDGDGLGNGVELRRTRTNPRKFDTDGDGFGDGAELRAGSNPNNSESVPSPGFGPPAPASPVSTPGTPPVPPIPPPVNPPPDTTPPNTTIKSGPSGTITSTGANFSFTSSESGSSFQCKLDSDSWAGCTSPKGYSSLALGGHTFSVKATDGAGNTDASPATRSWTIKSTEAANCTQTLSPGASLSNAVSSAAADAVLCLDGGSWSFNLSGVDKSSPVTVRSADGTTASLGYSLLNDSSNLRFQDLRFTGGAEMVGSSDHIEFRDSEFTGEFGIRANGDEAGGGTVVTDVVIDGNYMHDLDYTGQPGSGSGYGVIAVNGVEHFTITDNTIESVAADYIQSASPVDFSVVGNTFLGPSLVGGHPQEHQDLWQIFGGGDDITFADNVARDTGTHESLLFQEGHFTNVVIENNLFDHDSRGYTCQLYQSTGLVFRNNTVVGSRWGCLFRDEASSAPGSGYQVDHNVFADTESDVDVSTEGRAGNWGTYDYNVSSDGSANGAHSVRNWSPSWVDTVDYSPLGLPFSAGYQAP